MTKRDDKIPQKDRAAARGTRYVNRFALLAEGLPARHETQAADRLNFALKLIPDDKSFIKWLIQSARDSYEDMLHEQACTIARLKYRPQSRPRGRPRKQKPAVAKRNRGRPRSWNYPDLFRFYERGLALLHTEGVKSPTYCQCLERAAIDAVSPPLTAQDAKQCVKDLSLGRRLSDARKACGK